jgi:hypothetical protein
MAPRVGEASEAMRPNKGMQRMGAKGARGLPERSAPSKVTNGALRARLR